MQSTFFVVVLLYRKELVKGGFKAAWGDASGRWFLGSEGGQIPVQPVLVEFPVKTLTKLPIAVREPCTVTNLRRYGGEQISLAVIRQAP